MTIYLYNTPSRKKEPFTPISGGKVGMYTCGPTVYADAHIGNLRAYVTADVLRRMFAYNGCEVTHVVNITDVGHLTSDQDEGEDKMTAALRRGGKELTLENMRALGEVYSRRFVDDTARLNILAPEHMPRASDHIPEQIDLIKRLEEKGLTYQTGDGVYFDTARFPRYAQFAHLNLEGLKEGARVDAKTEKRNPIDFALWKFNDTLGWDSPWGQGFPGWHVECSAMSMKYLGEEFDVHTGGIDHIPVHHTNEVAQSECATGKPLAHYWMHTEFVNVESGKMAKSEGNIITLDALTEEGFHPLAYRYWLLTGHYRTPLTFSREALLSAQNALVRLHTQFAALGEANGAVHPRYKEQFMAHINDDLDMPKTVALVWELFKDAAVASGDKRATLLDVDMVLGLSLQTPPESLYRLLKTEVALEELPEGIKQKVADREQARREKDWERADLLRNEVYEAGYEIEDMEGGPKISIKIE